MAHPYQLSFGGKGGKGDTSGDWDCPSCGDRNFATRVACRKCGAYNPGAKMPDVNDIGFKTVMCAFFQADRCTKGAYCSFAHGEHELGLGRQMMEAKAESMPGPALHEAPMHIQQYLAGLEIKPLPLKQFLSMEHSQRELVMQQGRLNEARDPTAMLISRMVKVKKMANIQAKMKAAGTWNNPMALLAQAEVRPSSGIEYTVTFQPGPLGVGANWTSGRVDKVVTGGQGLALGVQVGDWFTKVNQVPYTEALLDGARASQQPFNVTLLRPQELAVAQGAVPQDLGQFAANLGMDWAFANGMAGGQ
eukprot:TRINITY_DN4054_c0_g1_i2.p1 TRINITY_DN4054_c0_g1~~TRINITY_DN4054_c0_g1_i2.p1  ORF type:complete len:317 (+),score=58.38 TRINITY_DN4054_c0_g1_i2:39-953(+)